MRLIVDLLSHLSGSPGIVQVQQVPAEGVGVAINGKYALPVPLDLDFPVDVSNHILDGSGNIDAESVVSTSFAHLLAAYPQYGNIYFNPLLTSDHVAELVLDQTFHFTERLPGQDPYFLYSRFQTGRENGVADDGQMPTHTALVARNTATTPPRPGLIITESIDIGPYTLDCNNQPVGADDFMVYWKLYSFEVEHDIAADAGAFAGVNTPAVRFLRETPPEPDQFLVYLTTDDGVNWCQVNLLEPIAFCAKTTTVRLAFRNDSAAKIYLASYALLF